MTFASCGTALLRIGRSKWLESYWETKTNQGRSGHTLLYALPTADSFPFPGSTRGQPTRKDKPGPWWWLQSSFYFLKSLLSQVIFSKMHVVYSFSVVKSGKIIRQLLSSLAPWKDLISGALRALLSLQHSRDRATLICCFANTCP